MQTHQNPPVALLSLRETAALLGVSRRFVEQETKTARLASVRIGRRRLIHPDDLSDYIESRRGRRELT